MDGLTAWMADDPQADEPVACAHGRHEPDCGECFEERWAFEPATPIALLAGLVLTSPFGGTVQVEEVPFA